MRSVYLIADDEVLSRLRVNDDAILHYILGKAQVEVWPYTFPFSRSKYSNIFVKEKVSSQSWCEHFELAMRKIDECELVIFVDGEKEKILTKNRILLDYASLTRKEIRTVSLSDDILKSLINPKIRVYFTTYENHEAAEATYVYPDKFEDRKE